MAMLKIAGTLTASLWRTNLILSQRAAPVTTSSIPLWTSNTSVQSSTDIASSSVPSSADVVVIGGGVAGCSTLYHLAKLGVSNAVLVEKDQLTAGTTWHTAGLFWHQRLSDVDINILATSGHMMTSLEEETGVNTGWINNGGMAITSCKERLEEYKRLVTFSKAFGIESHILSPEDVKKIYPLMDVDDLCGALYSPRDGTIDPAGYCQALTRGATSRGAKVIEGCSVTGVEVKDDDHGTKRVAAVQTNKGTIRTNCLVNAAGSWAPYLGQMAGVKVPLISVKHSYVVTERIEGIQNMPNIRNNDHSVYMKLQGDALVIGIFEENPTFLDEVPKDFAFSLFELDWDIFGTALESSIKRIPVLENTGIKSTICGPESFTPDHKALVGESPEVRGFYFSCGYNSSGMMLSGGCGKQVAKWIVDGKPELDMFAYDIRRFSTKLTDHKRWIKERSHEGIAKNYAIAFPHDQPLASRNMTKDPLYQVLLDAGSVYEVVLGWERPAWFSPEGAAAPLEYDYYGNYGHSKNVDDIYRDRLALNYTFDFPPHHPVIGQECLNCRQRVAVFNMSTFGKYFLVGPDAQKAANWIFSNDMTKAQGSVVYTCMLNKDGGIVSDVTVSMVEAGKGRPHDPSFEGKGFYIAAGGGQSNYVQCHIRDILQDNKWDCQLLDHTDDMTLISIQGPHSRDLLQTITDTDLSHEAFPFSTHKIVTVAGYDVRALRLSYVGELGWELHMPNDCAVAVYKAVMEAGQTYGIVNAGARAMDSLSIEKGYRHWHADIRTDDTPLEAGMTFTCKLKSDVPFLGRQALELQKKDGLKKRLACFTIEGQVPLHGLEVIWRDGRPVGYLRRADYAFALGKSIGYGYITHPEGTTVTMDYMKNGQYQIEHMCTLYDATLHTKTPFDPNNKRVKGLYDEPLPIHI